MVRLTVDVIARGTSGYAKKKRDESIQHYLKRLTHLYLEDRSIDEVGDDLNLCRNLIVLYLYDNKLSKVPNLNGNGNLTHLYLQNNHIQKIEGLNGLHKLSKLYIGGNCISVLEGLDKLTMLQELHLEHQRLPIGEKILFDPRTLVALMKSLQVLNISGNGLDTLRELQCLQGITQFMANDNQLNDMKELAHVIGSWKQLWRIDLSGNPLSHKAKYRDRVIIMAPSLVKFARTKSMVSLANHLLAQLMFIDTEVMDGKEITDTAKKFLQNWQANREKRKQETRHGTAISHMSSAGENGMPPSRTISNSAANRLGNEVPGYIMPALPRKQFQEVLARSTSQPHPALSNSKSYPDMSTAPRYLNTYGTPCNEPTRGGQVSAPSSATTGHKLSVIEMGSDFASGDGLSTKAS